MLVFPSAQVFAETSINTPEEFNACSQMKKSLDIAVMKLKPWIIEKVRNEIETIGIQPDELKIRYQQLIEEIHPLILSFLEKAGISVTFYSTDIRVKILKG